MGRRGRRDGSASRSILPKEDRAAPPQRAQVPWADGTDHNENAARMKGRPVNRHPWLGAILGVALSCSASPAGVLQGDLLERVNRHIGGRVVDHTHNHGADRRIWSDALGQPRDLYVYLPPGFNPAQCYPLMLWLHGFGQDEVAFLQYVVERLDGEIRAGRLPPIIAAAPDGSLSGEAKPMRAGSFFLNSNAGRFEDFLMQDVWNFLFTHYPLRPEREAHAITGVSMGGGAAFSKAIKYRDRFKVVTGVFPPVNTRWLDCHCWYMGNFRPDCWGWRTDFSRGNEVIGRFYGVIAIRLKSAVDPLYGRGPETAFLVSLENPIEMIDRLCLHEGELDMYIAYGGKDQFNIDAQVESFLFAARQRGLTVSVGYDPRGKHDRRTAERLFPGVVAWLGPLLAPYSPPLNFRCSP
jgi:S-formylglutathione hydrolase FrmB